MTKSEAQKLAQEIITCLAHHAGDIRTDSIYINVNDCESPQEDEGNVIIDPINKLFEINIYLTPGMSELAITKTICHEFAHICQWEWHLYDRLYVDSEDGTISQTMFEHCNESVAYRHENMFLQIWRSQHERNK